jgi:hypothetical protein
MEEKDFKRIEDSVSNVVDGKLGLFQKEFRQEIREDLGQFKKEIRAETREDLGQFKKEIRAETREDLGQFKKEFREDINEDFRQHVGILTEDFQHKLQIVAEGHQMLSEKLDRAKTDIEDKIGHIEKKVDVVAADIAAHRIDTEGHKKGYMVREP